MEGFTEYYQDCYRRSAQKIFTVLSRTILCLLHSAHCCVFPLLQCCAKNQNKTIQLPFNGSRAFSFYIYAAHILNITTKTILKINWIHMRAKPKTRTDSTWKSSVSSPNEFTCIFTHHIHHRRR